MGWVLIVLMAALVFVALWRFGRFDKAALQFLGAALLIALAGYAWQGRPGLEGKPVPPPVREKLQDRSEEHTSELQSLMRISYAVVCMKKTNITMHNE